MGKIEAGKLELEQEPFVLTDVISDARLFALAAKKRGLKFVEDITPALYPGPLAGDRVRLRQVLANFLSNAVKFTGAGAITLRVSQEDGSEPEQINVTFEVQDTGIGIDEAALPRLFTPFQFVMSTLDLRRLNLTLTAAFDSQADSSTARQYGGSGLGLFLTRSVS